jgi:hypothetical protein
MRRVSDQCKMLASAGTLSWYTSESSAYVIQGVSATVRGQSKLKCEGEPQGESRQAPEPPDTPLGTWSRKPEQMKAEMVCDARRKKFTYQHLYN